MHTEQNDLLESSLVTTFFCGGFSRNYEKPSVYDV